MCQFKTDLVKSSLDRACFPSMEPLDLSINGKAITIKAAINLPNLFQKLSNYHRILWLCIPQVNYTLSKELPL